MEYKGFYVKIQPRKVLRQNKENQSIMCEGFLIEIYDANKTLVDLLTAAVGYELLENCVEEVEQLVKDYIDCEKKCVEN